MVIYSLSSETLGKPALFLGGLQKHNILRLWGLNFLTRSFPLDYYLLKPKITEKMDCNESSTINYIN